MITLGATGDSVSPDEMATVAQDSKGNYYVGPVDTPGVVLIYDAAGKVIGSLGRRGQGPGEHMMIGTVKVGPGDTLYVFDAGLWRISLYSPSGRLVRTMQLPRRTLITDFQPQPSGNVLITTSLPAEGGAGYPLHLIGSRGEVLRSFGAINPVVLPDAPSPRGTTARAPNRAVWYAAHNRYELSRWTSDGQPDRTLVRRAAWFAPYELVRHPPDIQVEPPQPAVRGIAQESDSLLWVRVHVAASTWKRTWSPSRGRAPEIRSFNVYRGFFDTMLEAIDPRTGALLASRRLDTPLERLFGRDLTFTHGEDAEGYRYLDIWQFRLVTPNGTAW